MCIRSWGAFNMTDLEIGEHVCKKAESHAGSYGFVETKKKIISIVVCDVIALRSRRKESLKHLIFSGFFQGPKHVCTFLFSPRGKQDILKAFCFNE